jgi:hypothetical protein
MKAINFTEKELDFLRKQYQDELESARKYAFQISEILKKLGTESPLIIEESGEQEPKVIKRRGRKPKVKTAIAREPKKRGRKPKAVAAEPKVPKKRGRPFKVAVLPAVTTSPETAAKEPKPILSLAAKEVKKIITKKKTSRRSRKWKGGRLTPMSKPIQLKEPKEEPVEETASAIEPVVTPVNEPKE